MEKTFNIEVDEDLKNKSRTFIKKIKSGMYFKSQLDSTINSLEWLDEIELACPYIDNIVRAPRVALINEEEVQKIEKAKKIGVESVKDLAKHTNYIEKIDKDSKDVQPSKILVLLREETFNTYENRFIYTLIVDLFRFILEKEQLLKNLETKNDKKLEYAASTTNGEERVKIELKISAKETNNGGNNDKLKKEIEEIKNRLKRIKDYMAGWERSELFKSLTKAHVPFVVPPLKKTNMILKNPNFQMATRLWNYLRNVTKDDRSTKNNMNTMGDEILKNILDDAFLMDYFVLDSISSSKKEQKEKLTKYALIMIVQQVQRAMAILLNNGIKITEEELMKLISLEVNSEKNRSLIGSTDIKKKFQKAMDEYLAKTQDL